MWQRLEMPLHYLQIRLFASIWLLQFLQKRGVGESLTGNQALSPAQDLRMNF